LTCCWHMGAAAKSNQILGSNGLETAYLSSAAFDVGRLSLFDRCILKPAPYAWSLIFWCFLEGELAAAPPFFLRVRQPPLCISRLPLCKSVCDCWRSGAWLDEAADGCWSSLAAPSWLSYGGCHSLAALCIWRD